MTETKAEATGIVATVAKTTVDAVAAHWGKLLNTTLTVAVTAFGIWFTGVLTPAPAAPKVVEIVKTVPDAGSTVQRLTAIEAKIEACTAAIEKARSEVLSRFPEKKTPKRKPTVVSQAK